VSGPSRTAWVHCFSGVAGDMVLGALLDAGADLDEVRAIVRRLPVSGWSLDTEAVLRAGVAATRAIVVAPEDHHHRTWSAIRSMLGEAGLPGRVHDRAHAAFAALAEVEGALHRTSPDDVHFHEVGALDAIVDVVGTCAALEILDVDEVVCSPVATGHGTVRAAHGQLPVPAPAVARLLEGVPAVGMDTPLELATPTGVALVRTLASSFGPLPAMTVSSTGLGAGSRDLDGRPNVVQVLVGTVAGAGPGAGSGQPVVLLEANVDDATGEVLAHAVARLLDTGAHDAWITPIVMKKGRPAHTVAALADPATAAAVAAVLTAETGSLGVRGTRLEKWPAARTVETVDIEGHAVRVKVAAGRTKVEFDDAAAAAAALRLPVREVLARVEASARQNRG
jgi:pyridinium-3,5-bisthiocarboxylic acid mononucleotide nickel chelatase